MSDQGRLARPVRVRVPATSANLGPGYDCAGLALSLYDEYSIAPPSQSARAADGLVVRVRGEGAHEVPRDESHLVLRSLRGGLRAVGIDCPALELSCVNRIPHARGLGSSSAAIVGGLMLARAVAADGGLELDDPAVLRLATEIEGHPDNVAPALLGGFTLAWTETGRDPRGARALRLIPHPDLEPIAAVPATRLATAQARRLIPDRIAHADAAFNAARAALLVEAMTRRPDLLFTATEDRLHQDLRREGYPQSHALMTRVREHGVPAVISGAGPTVLAFGVRGSRLNGQFVRDLIRGASDEIFGAAVEIVPLAPDLAGATLLPG